MASRLQRLVIDSGLPLGRFLADAACTLPAALGCPGVSPFRVFPLPGGVRRGGGTRPSAADFLFHLPIGGLNLMYVGGWGSPGGLSPPSAAQQRVRRRFRNLAASFAAAGEDIATMKDLQTFLRHEEGYSSSSRVLPLGLLGGVPDECATVSLPRVLQDSDPAMAQQAGDPRLPVASEPLALVLKEPYIFMDRSDGARACGQRCTSSGGPPR